MAPTWQWMAWETWRSSGSSPGFQIPNQIQQSRYATEQVRSMDSGMHAVPRNPNDLLLTVQWLLRGLSAWLQGLFSQNCFFFVSFHYQWSVRRWTAVSQPVFTPCNRTEHPGVTATRQTDITKQLVLNFSPCRFLPHGFLAAGSLWPPRSSSHFAVIAKTDQKDI